MCARHFLVDVRLHCAERVSSASRSLRHSPGPIESRIGVCVRAAVSTAGHQSVGFQETAEFGLRRDFLASHGRGLRPSKYHSNGSIESSSHGQGNRSIISFLIPFNSFFFFFEFPRLKWSAIGRRCTRLNPMNSSIHPSLNRAVPLEKPNSGFIDSY